MQPYLHRNHPVLFGFEMVTISKIGNKLPRIGIVVCVIILFLNFRLKSSGFTVLWSSNSDSTTEPPREQFQHPASNAEHNPTHLLTSQDTQQATLGSPHASSPSTTATTIPTAPGTIPGIPGKVWQSAKDRIFTKDEQTIIDSWLEKNPSFRYELLTDQSADNYVITRYNETRPDIVTLYTGLSIPILKADLLRYLILLSDGGIWSDIDVTCEVDVGHWLPADMYRTAPDISLVVGLEFDIAADGPRPVYSQLTNWVFAARPGSPHLLYVVNSIVKGLYDIAEENSVQPSGITLDMISDVVDVTGPKIMTLGIVESLGQLLGRTVDDRDIAGNKKPHLVGDVLVMPGAAFAALQNGFPKDQVEPLVSHHYAGSWKGPADEARERRKKLQEAEKQKAER